MRQYLPRSYGLLLAALLTLLPPRVGMAWGDETHRAIARGAAVVVSDKMRPFFLANSEYIAFHSTDPDYIPNRTQEQKAEHFLDIDTFGQPPFSALPHDRKQAEAKFGADVMAQRGLLPWAIEREFNRLANALTMKDYEETRLAAAHLAHFVSDATMPLHATVNYDGQETGNKGIHLRIEIEMLPRYHSTSHIRAGKPFEVNAPVEWAFKTIEDSWTFCPALLKADTAARKAAPLDSELYYAELERGCGELLQKRMELAATALASFWTAAWKQAGSPSLPPETVVVVIEPPRVVRLFVTADDVEWVTAFGGALGNLLRPFDAVAYCEAEAPVYLRSFTLQFMPSATGATIGKPPTGRRFGGDLRDCLGMAIRALDQFPGSRRIIILVSEGWKPDPAILDQARLMKEKGIRGLFLVKGTKEASSQAEELAAQSGGRLVRLAAGASVDEALKENLPTMLAPPGQ